MSFGDENADQHHVERMVVERRWDRGWQSTPADDAREVEAHRAAEDADADIAALEDKIQYLSRNGCDCLRQAWEDLERLRGHRRNVGMWIVDYRGSKNAGTDDRQAAGDYS